MVTINLRDFYEEYYQKDCFIEVPEEVAAVLKLHKREDARYKKRMERKRMFLSLDCDDGVEYRVLCLPVGAEKEYLQRHERQAFSRKMQDVFACLSETQARRIYAHCILGLTKTRIAEMDGVKKTSVAESIKRGLKKMNKYF